MSSDLSLYDMTVPLFTKRLQQMSHHLEMGEQWCRDNDKPTSTLVEARIHEDMKPLAFQVQTCYRVIIQLFSRLEIAETPKDTPEVETSMEGLLRQIAEMHALLGTATRASFENMATRQVSFEPPGRDPWKFTSVSFVQGLLLPNFFFHSVTAYNILRQLGVPLGKFDYLGDPQAIP
ncbi:hypothetical protein LTR85_000197 [Meristemomyces frigidus]|nr:hypothetical protein LTR85_000197 [Meristemomyces frigidus]